MICSRNLEWGPCSRPLTPPLNLALSAGTVTAVLGANGSGKSSLLKVLAGLIRPLAGELKIAAAQLGATAYLQQHQALDRQYPINLQHLVDAGQWRSRLSRTERRERLHAVLVRWQLIGLESRPLSALSGGELQRALLARIDLQDPRLLLLDEPESAMDESGQQLFWNQVKRWQNEGRTVLVVCHNHIAVCRHVEQALWISAECCQFGSPAQLLAGRISTLQAA
ncbi:MAG TPA: ATP-binding cassette domain-containing protein [Pseudomonas xinjiangensis]|uniref:ATP-binding cassette domain-containing protein n=2 Tax=root TaxID=1 RepID=A0A7V1BS29_9GAMM|nr:ATP-binding cassette domain-containing protein [Halopseudomonas xinjiangensis]HEC46975.1 ATP-binding cassette domain-containing protein [Halopseudomonas xinjiangensis]